MNTLLRLPFILTLIAHVSLIPAVHSQTATPTVPKVVNGSLPHVSPNGKRIVFSSNRNGTDDLFVINSDGSETTQLTNTAEHEAFVTWTADNKSILFYVLKDDRTNQRQLTR